MSRFLSIVLILGVGIFLGALTPQSSGAQSSTPEIRLSPEFGPAGTVVTIQGSNAPPHATVWVLWLPWPAGYPCEPPAIGAGFVAEVSADGDGNFTATHHLDIETSGPGYELQGATYFAKAGELQSEFVCFSFTEAADQPNVRYFPETGHVVGHGFLSYWNQFGGLEFFGYPLTGEFVDPETGLVTQWFERARFEWHPGVWPERHDVLAGRLGAELHPSRQPDYPTGPYPFSYEPASGNPNCRFFPMPVRSDPPSEVGYNVCHGFRSYWEQYGGLASFGYPLSREYRDPESGLVVQWFERARFEWHPGVWPERHDVLLGRLGAEALGMD
jgi:hypothetical protein